MAVDLSRFQDVTWTTHVDVITRDIWLSAELGDITISLQFEAAVEGETDPTLWVMVGETKEWLLEGSPCETMEHALVAACEVMDGYTAP